MKLAVIGSGISGLSAAYHFSKNHKVDLFEQDDHFGGHSLTYDIKEEDKVVPVDLGFIVFNEKTYPNLINFFKELKVDYEKSNMSLAVSIKGTKLEYAGKSLGSLFCNKSNYFNIQFIKLIFDIIKFYKSAPNLLTKENENLTLGDYLEKNKASQDLKNYHIIMNGMD